MTEINCSHLILKPHDIDLVIYHAKCSDGFGSALASYVYFEKTSGLNASGNKIVYHPAAHWQSPPPVSGLNVLICDFSYGKDTMHKLIEDAKCVAILDHHKTAQEALKDIPDKYKVFRMDHSGAYITWKYFFPDEDPPLLIKYIEDNDIWIKEMPNTREVTSYVFSLPFEFEEYKKLLDPNEISRIIPIANGMQYQNESYINNSLSSASLKFVQIDDMYFFVASVNSTVLKSEIGNRLFTKYEHVNFSSVYSKNDSQTYVSLRSTDTRTDVSQIASLFGGGGHRNASGMSSYFADFHNVLDVNTLYNLLNNIYARTFPALKCNIVYLNTTHCKKQICKYLLQTRYFNKSTQKEVCEYNSILNDLSVQCDLACVWNYDGSKNKTWFTLSWTKNVQLDDLQTVFNNETDFHLTNNNTTIIFSRGGCVNQL